MTLRADVDAAKASTKAKLAAEAASMPSLRTFMSALMTYVKAAYVGSPDVLADFGISLKSRAPLTVEAKAAAVAKRAATRAARHTMGTQQKKAIKGAVTGVLVTPITAARPPWRHPAARRPPLATGVRRLRRAPPRQQRTAQTGKGVGRSREWPAPGPLAASRALLRPSR